MEVYSDRTSSGRMIVCKQKGEVTIVGSFSRLSLLNCSVVNQVESRLPVFSLDTQRSPAGLSPVHLFSSYAHTLLQFLRASYHSFASKNLPCRTRRP